MAVSDNCTSVYFPVYSSLQYPIRCHFFSLTWICFVFFNTSSSTFVFVVCLVEISFSFFFFFFFAFPYLTVLYSASVRTSVWFIFTSSVLLYSVKKKHTIFVPLRFYCKISTFLLWHHFSFVLLLNLLPLFWSKKLTAILLVIIHPCATFVISPQHILKR